MKLIAETAWHHEGDYEFMKSLVSSIAAKTEADIVKLHITLDFDEYMDSNHEAYNLLKPWLFDRSQWANLIKIIRDSGKEIMLLLNDVEAIEFGMSFSPEYVEIHSVCLNDLFILEKLKQSLYSDLKVVLGIGGTSIDEIDYAINYLDHPNILLMFGFQNYPTVYKDVNLRKIRKIMKLFDNFEFGYADHTAWNSPENELVTLLGAASGMNFIEKRVTTHFGESRVDWPAAISLDMFNNLKKKLNILEDLNGNGDMSMNEGELSYSVFGPMKKAAVLIRDIRKGEIFSMEMIKFIRLTEISDMSQLDVINSFGKIICMDLNQGQILTKNSFQK